MLAGGGTATAAAATINRYPSSSPPSPNLAPKLSYKCFPSYQALGGHKASHRKLSDAADDLTAHSSNGLAGVLLTVWASPWRVQALPLRRRGWNSCASLSEERLSVCEGDCARCCWGELGLFQIQGGLRN
ncbi:Zinc finger protein AZF2 [Acorus gramineus]|uniref:Zinc finger protein AZF2 n=1 Tax=Acorus gramineus TaxID=55184 RepID=A0AAV9ADB5_ACOGR|nr:Zinc finger protein AZF2 [Acorus gramineus]KAK1262194.1 Zinc finger protein AZF2 [Acorus gramineus]